MHTQKRIIIPLAFYAIPFFSHATTCAVRGFGTHGTLLSTLVFVVSFGILSILIIKKLWTEFAIGSVIALLVCSQFLYLVMETTSFAFYDFVKSTMSFVGFIETIFVALLLLVCVLGVLQSKTKESTSQPFLSSHITGLIALLILSSPVFLIQWASVEECNAFPIDMMQ